MFSTDVKAWKKVENRAIVLEKVSFQGNRSNFSSQNLDFFKCRALLYSLFSNCQKGSTAVAKSALYVYAHLRIKLEEKIDRHLSP